MEKIVLPKYRKMNLEIENNFIIGFWDKAVEAYEKGAFTKSALYTLKYLNPDSAKALSVNKKQIDMVIRYGLANIRIKIENDRIFIESEISKLTNKGINRVALFRKIAEINFTAMDLMKIVLNEDRLLISYNTETGLTNPDKFMDIIYETAYNSDMFAAHFKKYYGTDIANENNITPLDRNKTAETIEWIREGLKEYREDFQKIQKAGKNEFRWDLSVILAYKLYLNPLINGTLRYDLKEHIDRLYDRDVDLNMRIDTFYSFFTELDTMKDSDLAEMIYRVKRDIGIRKYFSRERITQELNENLETLNGYRANGNDFAISFFLYIGFLNILGDFKLDKTYRNTIQKTLQSISQSSPKIASDRLQKLFGELYKKGVSGNTDSKAEKIFWGFIIIIIAVKLLKSIISG